MNRQLLEVAGRHAAEDPELQELLAELPQEWAQIPADEDGKALFLAYMRQAYGAGYIRALSEGEIA